MKNVTNNNNYSLQEFVQVLFMLATLIGVGVLMFKTLVLFFS